MPEGHTLHGLARLHQRRYARRPVAVSSPQERFADGAALVDGRVLRKASAWGKHLFHHYDGGVIVHVHLGLYGSFTEWELPAAAPVGQVRMRMRGDQFGTDLRGPTACEIFDVAQMDAVIARLGPDPLRKDADSSRAWQRIHRSQRPIGALLMDQAVVAGVGNVFRAELLFRHGIDPMRPGVRVSQEEFDLAWSDLVELMHVGLRRGKIHTIRREHDHGAPSYRQGRPRTYVYRRAGEPCRVCSTPVLTSVLEGRNVFWCPNCQM